MDCCFPLLDVNFRSFPDPDTTLTDRSIVWVHFRGVFCAVRFENLKIKLAKTNVFLSCPQMYSQCRLRILERQCMEMIHEMGSKPDAPQGAQEQGFAIEVCRIIPFYNSLKPRSGDLPIRCLFYARFSSLPSFTMSYVSSVMPGWIWDALQTTKTSFT